MVTETPKNGLHTEYFENGQEKIETNYRDGRLHGKFTSWHWHGGIKSDVYYINDKVDGITQFTDYYGDFYLSWYMNGELAGTCGDDGVWEYTELGNKIMSEIMSEND